MRCESRRGEREAARGRPGSEATVTRSGASRRNRQHHASMPPRPRSGGGAEGDDGGRSPTDVTTPRDHTAPTRAAGEERSDEAAACGRQHAFRTRPLRGS